MRFTKNPQIQVRLRAENTDFITSLPPPLPLEHNRSAQCSTPNVYGELCLPWKCSQGTLSSLGDKMNSHLWISQVFENSWIPTFLAGSTSHSCTYQQMRKKTSSHGSNTSETTTVAQFWPKLSLRNQPGSKLIKNTIKMLHFSSNLRVSDCIRDQALHSSSTLHKD